MSLNVGERCYYTFTGSEFTGPFPPYSPTAGVTRGADVLLVTPGSPTTYCIAVQTRLGDDGANIPFPLLLDGIEYSSSVAQGKVSPVNWAQVPAGAIATAIAAANTAASGAASTATTANNAVASTNSAVAKLSQARVQNTTASVGITAGAAATTLETTPDYAMDAGKAILADATMNVVNASLLATATVTVALDKSENGGSNWTNVATKAYTLAGAVGVLIPSVATPSFSGLATRASAGNMRLRLTVSSTGANVTVTERGLAARWAQTPA